MKYNKPKLYKDQTLTGDWQVTIKIDGARAFLNTQDRTAVSRAGKPFFNFNRALYEELWDTYGETSIDCEVFRNSWKETMTLLRKEGSSLVTLKDIYVLTDHNLDRRLQGGWITNPTKEDIKEELSNYNSVGFEGIVLRQFDTWYKVKPTETFDVPVIGVQEGTGRNKGRMGALLTTLGKVGTGYTDKDRDELFNIKVGTMIEVNCMELTKDGKFRHPVFVRVREDKT